MAASPAFETLFPPAVPHRHRVLISFETWDKGIGGPRGGTPRRCLEENFERFW